MTLKKLIPLCVIFVTLGTVTANAQNFFKDHYVSHNVFTVFKSDAITLINSPDEPFHVRGTDGFNFATKHGFIFFKYFSVQIGTGIDYVFQLKSLSIPFDLDFKVYLSRYAESGLYFLLGNSSAMYHNRFESVENLRFGVGLAVETAENYDLIIELCKNNRSFQKDNIYISSEILSLGIGIKF